ncbi:probable serine/threonine-protein kinase At1g54610 [Zingiber officinale]|uniref:probable serine/threonine-protein kinase At1g54610 n=1 Tax=Zingiber officinale TaxID=94328 RepID=UPI001C4D43F7|nr:probable serine/threonine-protein kinase At1g54610 [Zingiber officinale]
MGCVQAKGSSNASPSQADLHALKRDNGYLPGSHAVTKYQPLPDRIAADGGGKASTGDEEGSEGVGVQSHKASLPLSQPVRPSSVDGGEDELIGGWPKWLVANVSPEILVGFVPKSADCYEKLDKIGQGTYSNVYKARDRDTGKIVALKKVRFDTSESESVKFMAREIMMLQKLDHPNVIKLEGLATSRMHYSLYLVFDFMQCDLSRIISRSDIRLTEPQIKCYMKQLLSGLQHCHERGILHRDIKGSNLLIDRNGILKIADFGLANFYDPNIKVALTSRVVTLWYRAPELLLGTTDYGVGIDLWSAGCLLAEMFVGKPIIAGRNEIEQLQKIFMLCGSPSDDFWKKLKLTSNFQPPPPHKSTIFETFKDLPSSALSLLIVLLALEPSNRGTAVSALQSIYFTTSPSACDLSGLPLIYKESNESVQSRERRKNKASRVVQQSRKHKDTERKLDTTKMKRYSGSSNEEKPVDLSNNSQEPSSSTGSTSSSTKPQKSPPALVASLSLITDPIEEESCRTEGGDLAYEVTDDYEKASMRQCRLIKRSASPSEMSRHYGRHTSKVSPD